MPSMITDLEPAFKACSGIGSAVWDPPITFPTTTEIPLPIITPMSAHSYPDQKNTPMPGPTIFDPNAIPIMTVIDSYHIPSPNIVGPKGNAYPNPQSKAPVGLDPSTPKDIAQLAVVTVGNALVTASLLQNSAHVQFGSHILTAGGAALVTNDITISYSQHGRLDVGSTEAYYLGRGPAPTTVLSINGKPVTIAIDAGGPQQRGSLVIGTITLKPDDPASLINGQLLSYGTDGNLYQGTKTVASISWNSLAMNSLSDSKSASSRGSQSLEGSEGSRGFDGPLSSRKRKKSGARRLVDTLPDVLTLFGFILGAWLIFRLG
jgi:hypothetical protein